MNPPNNWPGPLRLRPQFTPTSRTPWGGQRIAKIYGSELGLPAGQQVGEAWVMSLDPQFPSMVGETPLAEIVDATLLVKLLDAAQPLSVQIHPSDAYVGLGPLECGKPEAWYVVARDPGAGLFLGFKPHVDAAEVRAVLSTDADLSQRMHFVPVEPGDFFLIEAGTPHAIGAGVTLVEPQRVIAGSSGVTYRYWDWGRRYDAAGVPCPDGEPRQLHADHAIAVTDWARVTSDGFVDSIRRRAGIPNLGGAASITILAQHAVAPSSPPSPATTPLGESPALTSADLQVARVAGTGSCALPPWRDVAMGVTVLEGSVLFPSGERVQRGETAVLPAGASGASVLLSAAHAVVMTARPV